MAIIKVNSDNFEEEVLKEKKVVLVDFNANWCGPCRMLEPVLEEMSNENDKFKFVSINIDKDEELASKYNVFSIPCMILFKDGNEVSRSIGFKPKEEIEKMLGGKKDV